MSKRKILLFALILLFLVLSTLYLLNYRTPNDTTLASPPPQNNPTSDGESTPKGPVLTVPESPIGTIGMISALMAGLGLFATTKRKKPT